MGLPSLGNQKESSKLNVDKAKNNSQIDSKESKFVDNKIYSLRNKNMNASFTNDSISTIREILPDNVESVAETQKLSLKQ